MKYYEATDAPSIDLSELASSDSREISEEVVLGYDAAGNLVGIDIDDAPSKIAMERVLVSNRPGRPKQTLRKNALQHAAQSVARSTDASLPPPCAPARLIVTGRELGVGGNSVDDVEQGNDRTYRVSHQRRRATPLRRDSH